MMTRMRVIFRVDASIRMGTGHVMRCLTLAAALRERGASCSFACRGHPGHLIEHVRASGFACAELPSAKGPMGAGPPPAHADWLGAAWEDDARQMLAAVSGAVFDWLVVDHYALDARWEGALQVVCRQVMVIDDLADRPHQCALLLDQNLGRSESAYARWVPARCRVLAGPHYGLLRPEFAALRGPSLARRKGRAVRRLLVAMGGVDAEDWTGRVLDALKCGALTSECVITVVMGPKAPWLEDVRARASRMPCATEVLVNARDMAQHMAHSDIAIGAAGTTAWERSCLGLPTLLVVVADNQKPAAQALAAAGAAVLLPNDGSFATALRRQLARLATDAGALARLQQAGAALADGLGAGRVATEMLT
jgi:UDP-2,4-diacetamido-2,4,6-trideoxy-beta-L-altropyranose hydrolase